MLTSSSIMDDLRPRRPVGYMVQWTFSIGTKSDRLLIASLAAGGAAI